jgi:hypothetical protein
MDFLSHPAFWIVLAAASELIGMSPLKQQHWCSFCFMPCAPSSQKSADQLR